MQQSKGKYDDGSDTIDNIFEILWALCKIEDDILESMDVSDEMDCEFQYANYLFDAFKGKSKRK